MFKKILVPTDGSALSRQTAQRAIQFAKEAGTRLVVLTVTPEYALPYYGEGGLVMPDSPEQFAKKHAERASHHLGEIAKWCGDVDVACDVMLASGKDPYVVIIETAEKTNCDLIFMASHGRRGLSAMLLGSETHKVLTHSKIPVLVYR